MIGTVVAYKYEVVQELSSDALFDVYRAVDRSRNRPAKLRVLRQALAADADFVDALKEVVAEHTHFNHPGLERAFEMEPHNDTWVVASEFEEGSVLEDRLRRLTSFSIQSALGASIHIAEALEACHQAGVIHGDISTRTIYSRQSDGVKLMMAGYWRAYATNSFAARQALPNMAPYLAPEINRGSMPSQSSDIYALGVLLFRLLSGRFPFLGNSPAELAEMHASALPPSLRKSNASIPHALDSVILRCLAKNPDDRYQRAKDVVKELRMIQDALRFGRPIRTVDHADAEAETTVVQPRTVRIEAVKPASAAPGPAKVNEITENPEKKKRRRSDGLPLGVAIAGYLGLLLMAFIIAYWAYFNMSAPQIMKVPNLVGQTIQDAQTSLRNESLTFTVVEKASDKAKGTVIDTDPAAGGTVRQNFPVQLTVSAGSLFVAVPDLRGRSLDEARTILGAVDLDLAKDVGREYRPGMQRDLIVAQVPEPREKVQRQSRIRVVVNSGVPTENSRFDGKWHTYSLEVPLPDAGGDEDLTVRVDLSDEGGTTTIHEGQHRPGEVMGVKVNAKGAEIMFRIYVNNELWDQVNQVAPSAVPPQEPPA